MEPTDNHNNGGGRRRFLGTITAGAATAGIAGLFASIQQARAGGLSTISDNDPEDLFKQLRGKHRIVFDVTRPHDILPFAWPRVFLMTNELTGTPSKDCSVVVVLRHDGIPYAMQSSLWEKYNFGEVFHADDPASKKPATRNPFWKPAKGAFVVPGFGEVSIGINELQDSGVKFCVCEAALTVYSAGLAQGLNVNAADLKKEWISGLLPGIQPVPSGVWAISRAQENGCSYCYAG